MQEKDAFLMAASNPPVADGIQFTPAIDDTFLQLGSSYNTTDESSIMDIIDLYWNMDFMFYIMLIIAVSIFSLSWIFVQSMLRKFSKGEVVSNSKVTPPTSLKSALWSIMSTCLNQDSNFSKFSSPFPILCLSFAIFQFFVANIALNEIGSDLKVFKDPKVITGYADIIERNDVQVLFFEGLPENAYFSNVSKDSPEGKIWSKRILVSSDDIVSTIGTLFPRIIEQKLVAIQRDVFIETALLFRLQYSQMNSLQNVRSYIARDETGKHFTDHLIYGSSSPDYLKSSLEKS